MADFDFEESKRIVNVKYQLQDLLFAKMGHLDSRVQVLVKMYGIVTGGASASLFHGKEPNDYDIFFKNEHARDEFQKLLKEDSIIKDVADVDPKYGVEVLVNGKLVTSHAVTFKNGIQIVTMDTSNARETFDYVHTMPWYDCDERKYYISHAQYKSIIDKKLVKNLHPKSYGVTEKRMKKFIDRGWTI
jgi:hypothetical protein